jgi:hypothetical protein
MVSLKTVVLLATSALASPLLSTRQANTPDLDTWTWTVQNWEAGCLGQSCSFDFNVTVPTVANVVAGVKAHCHATETDNNYVACELLEGANNRVAAKLKERNGTHAPAEFAISFLKASVEGRSVQTPPLNLTSRTDPETAHTTTSLLITIPSTTGVWASP